MTDQPSDNRKSQIYLVGGGVVGRAVAAAHLRAGLAIHLIELDEPLLLAAVQALQQIFPEVQVSHTEPWGPSVQVCLTPEHPKPQDHLSAPLMIESIVERRDYKQQLLLLASQLLGKEALLATNTSTLPLRSLVTDAFDGKQLVGLHFFMPVEQRFLVEVVCGEQTDPARLATAEEHVRRLNRRPLCVQDGPGFVVNRMLGPYLNHALMAICQGAAPDRVEAVAVAAGMPMGPLELLDLISLETGYHAGREILQAFPKRIEPLALLPGMIKKKLLGRHYGIGFYEYSEGTRSPQLAPRALARIADYSRDERLWTDEELREWIFLPMMIESAFILYDKIVSNADALELAMSGGLDLKRPRGFFDLWDEQSPRELVQNIDEFQPRSCAFVLPPEFRETLLACDTVYQAIQQYALKQS